MKSLIKNPIFWLGIYAFIVSLVTVILSILYAKHECKVCQKCPEISNESRILINTIDNANTKDDLDSLLLELYGFQSK